MMPESSIAFSKAIAAPAALAEAALRNSESMSAPSGMSAVSAVSAGYGAVTARSMTRVMIAANVATVIPNGWRIASGLFMAYAGLSYCAAMSVRFCYAGFTKLGLIFIFRAVGMH